MPDAEEKLFEALDWFNLIENESPRKGGKFSPYRQSERLGIYKKYADELIAKDYAYYCFCTQERLAEMRNKQQLEKRLVMYDKHCRIIPSDEAKNKVNNNEQFVVRMKVPENSQITYKDEIRGEITVESNTVDDQVIIKSDGFPTYHLALVVDDHEMEITHVVRGPEWLSSTPKHFLLYKYFGWTKPFFFHTPLLSNPDHSKLSKRHGHTNVSWYQENGFLPEAILNFLSLLGWSHPEEKEIFSIDEFIRLVDLKDLKPVAPVFDLKKLTWMNQQYIQNMDKDALLARLKTYDPSFEKQNDAIVTELLLLAKTRMETLKDFFSLTSHVFAEPVIKIRDQKDSKIAHELAERLATVSVWSKDEILTVCKSVMTKNGVKMPILYYLLTGMPSGLPLPETLAILGKERTIKRLSTTLS